MTRDPSLKARLLARLSANLMAVNGFWLGLAVVAFAVALSALVVLVIEHWWPGLTGRQPLFAALITPLIVATPLVTLLLAIQGLVKGEVTKRLETEQNLKEAQRIAHFGNWVHDLQHDALSWSDEIFVIFEIDPQQTPPSYATFLELIHPEDRKAVNAAYRHAVERSTPYEITHRLLMPDGRIKFVHERGESFRDAAGKPLRTIGTVQDITDQVRLEQELERRATTDPLTGLYNRYRLNDALTQEIKIANRYDVPLSLIMIDIDHFKRINDAHGHAVGDRMLVHLANTTRSLIRKSDIFSRWGGEEFLILAPHTALAEATALAERIREEVERSPCEGVQMTISLGVADYCAGERDENFVGRADQALYEAKGAGRNRVMVAPAMPTDTPIP